MTTVINSENNGTPVIAQTDVVGAEIDDYVINTLSAIASTPHVKLTSSGVECGVCRIANVVSRTTAKTSPAGPVLIIGSDVSYAGNQKQNGSVIERCHVYGSYIETPTIPSNTGLHAIELGWNNKPSATHNYVEGAAYGIVVKGGGYDCALEGYVTGNCIVNMGSALVAPSDGITIKGLSNLLVDHNFIFQGRAKAFSVGAVCSRKEAGTYDSGDIYFRNNVVILDNGGSLFNITSGAIKGARSNLYYAPNGAAFNGLSWANWLAAGRASDADFEKGSMYIRNPSFGTTWEIYDDTGTKISTVTTNPLLSYFKVFGEPKLKNDSPCIDAGAWITGVNDTGEADHWGNYVHRLPNIGADQGAGSPGSIQIVFEVES